MALDEIAERSGLELRTCVDALTRLTSSGLVVVGSEGQHVLISSAFAEAARAAAPVETAPGDDDERVLRTFIVDGRLVSLPTQRSKRLIVLDHIAQDFEPGLRYSEQEVSDIVARWHDDYAAIRRWLVDEAFLTREAGVYWRSGGNVDV